MQSTNPKLAKLSYSINWSGGIHISLSQLATLAHNLGLKTDPICPEEVWRTDISNFARKSVLEDLCFIFVRDPRLPKPTPPAVDDREPRFWIITHYWASSPKTTPPRAKGTYEYPENAFDNQVRSWLKVHGGVEGDMPYHTGDTLGMARWLPDTYAEWEGARDEERRKRQQRMAIW